MTDLDQQKPGGKSARSKKKQKKAERQQNRKAEHAQAANELAEAVVASTADVETAQDFTAQDFAPVDTAPAAPVEEIAAVEAPPAKPAERVASFSERMASYMQPAESAQTDTTAKAAAPAGPQPAPSPATAPAAGIQAIANAYRDYTKQSLEDAQSFAAKLTAARSLDKAMEAQTEFARQACETFADNSRKIRELHRELFWQTFRLPNWPGGRTPR